MLNRLKDGFKKLKQALTKTKAILETEISDKSVNINEDFFDDLFEKFIRADIGFKLSDEIVKKLKENINNKNLTLNELNTQIKNSIKINILALEKTNQKSSRIVFDKDKLNICFIVGVNGSGKTTSVGKLANKFKTEGFKVLIVAADTFRAAAKEQLVIWGEKAKVDVFTPDNITKPDAVVFKALEKAKAENYNFLLIDTAGRLHSQSNLMDELKKTHLVIEKNAPDSIYEKLIVLDATIGQNAISQAKQFSHATKLTGIILAKLDSSSKGGVVLNIMHELSLPVQYIGTGEKLDDLLEFELDEYIEGLIT